MPKNCDRSDPVSSYVPPVCPCTIANNAHAQQLMAEEQERQRLHAVYKKTKHERKAKKYAAKAQRKAAKGK